ncbi:MAG TPA: hypothetical protein VLA56_18100 [Pseudomonadales bacterium]|nr:hypothetical protein [Pseudomonadales bacterium]
MSGHFELMFQGEIYASVDPVKARADMAKLFKQPAEKVHRLFDGRSWVLKDGLDRSTAERYQVELAKIGVITELRDKSPTVRAPMPDDPHAKSQNFTLESVAITRMACPECKYEQLDADYCARCGVNIQVAEAKARLKAKEDEVIQQRIRALRGDEVPAVAPVAAPVRPMGMVHESTREFHGTPPRAGVLPWVLGSFAVFVIALGGLIAAGIVTVNF